MPSSLPLVPGLEILGTVRKTGDRVRKVKVGDRAGIQSLFSSCLQCEYCTSGRENLSERPEITEGRRCMEAMLSTFLCSRNL
ncbi:MAG: alcohol dehydrogenase catalytic domain-containing protein [Nitrososphaera sp.]